MDELDLLKKDWKKQEANLPKMSYDDIYNMIHKKSMYGVGNYMVVSPKIAEALRHLDIKKLRKDKLNQIFKNTSSLSGDDEKNRGSKDQLVLSPGAEGYS